MVRSSSKRLSVEIPAKVVTMFAPGQDDEQPADFAWLRCDWIFVAENLGLNNSLEAKSHARPGVRSDINRPHDANSRAAEIRHTTRTLGSLSVP
jgi:hypothetical protein